MATTEEIERRVAEADAARSARRSAAAQRVGELAVRRATIAEQLQEVERELGDVLVESSDVIEISELATFTELPTTDLTRWLESRKSNRAKRKKTAGSSSVKSTKSQQPSTPPAKRAASVPSDTPAVRGNRADTSPPITAEAG